MLRVVEVKNGIKSVRWTDLNPYGLLSQQEVEWRYRDIDELACLCPSDGRAALYSSPFGVKENDHPCAVGDWDELLKVAADEAGRCHYEYHDILVIQREGGAK